MYRANPAFRRKWRAIVLEATYILFNGAAVALNWSDAMTTLSTTRLLGAFSALVMTVALNGGMLFMFDRLAHNTDQSATVVSLQTVTIVGKRV